MSADLVAAAQAVLDELQPGCDLDGPKPVSPAIRRWCLAHGDYARRNGADRCSVGMALTALAAALKSSALPVAPTPVESVTAPVERVVDAPPQAGPEHRAGFRYRLDKPGMWGTCTCGWSGPTRIVWDNANEDVAEHLNTIAQGATTSER